MDVREAVAKAREYISDVYAEEEIRHVGLEEVRFDDATNAWKVTIGFFRAWSEIAPSPLQMLGDRSNWKRRAFKVIQIDDGSGRVVSMTHRVVK